MRNSIYVVWDTKANAPAVPFLEIHHADAVAIRNFSDAVNNERTPFARHPDDYELRVLGNIEDDGELATYDDDGYTVVITARQIVDAQNATKE